MEKRKKKMYLLFGVKAIIFILLIAAIYSGLQYIVVDDTSSMTRITFHEFYQREKDIDTIFLGPSHIFRGIDAEVVSGQTGRQCFDLSTSSQRLSASYYLLKEAEEYYNIDSVYLEVSLSTLSARAKADTPTYIISDYMKNTWNKYQMVKANVEAEEYINAFSPLCRNINILESPLNLGNKLWSKKDEAYKNYEWVGEDYVYCERGYFQYVGQDFFSSVKSVNLDSNDMNNTPENFDEKQLQYLYAIIDECKEKDISLTMFVMPFSNLYVAAQMEQYTDAIAYLEKMAEEKQVGFIDFNAIARTDLKLDDSCFNNLDHLNKKGGEIFSDCIADYMNNVFSYQKYDSAVKRLENEQDVYGVAYHISFLDEIQMFEIEITPVSGLTSIHEWQAYIMDEDDEIRCEWEPFANDKNIIIKIPVKYSRCKLCLKAMDKENRVISTSSITI